jgi:hypothetical protein
MTIFQMKNGNVEPVAIIKAGKTTKLGSEGAAAAAPAAPAAAPAPAQRQQRHLRRRWPRTRRKVSALASTKAASLGAPFLFRGCPLRRQPAQSPNSTNRRPALAGSP